MFSQFVLLAIGLAILVFGADLLVRGARAIALAFGISTLVVGLTVVAFGTSAPELFVSVAAALDGKGDVAIGNVIGSNIFNILIIIGLTALLAPIHIARSISWREMPIMLISAGLFWIFAMDGTFSQLEGAVFAIGIFLYIAENYFVVRFGSASVTSELLEEIEEEEVAEEKKRPMFKNILFIVLGLAGLIAGADLVVDNATLIAKSFGISDLVIGVTLVAVGTSLPELATTIVAAVKGEPDLAVGNAVGSNIFNVLCVIGFTAIIQPLNVAEPALRFDFPYMFFACILFWPLMIVSGKLGRISGIAMIGVYGAYVYLTLVGA